MKERVLKFNDFVLNEARKADAEHEYTEDKDKKTGEVKSTTLKLSGASSAEVTNLAKKYHEADTLIKEYQKITKEIGPKIKDIGLEMFDDVDKLNTMYIKTKSWEMTLSGSKPKPDEVTSTVNLEKVLDEVSKYASQFIPEFMTKLKEIIELCTEVKTIPGDKGAATSLRGVKKIEEGLFEDTIKVLKKAWKKLKSSVMDIINKFSPKMDAIEKKAKRLKVKLPTI